MFLKNKLNLSVKNLQNQKVSKICFELQDYNTIKKNPSTKGGRILGAKDRARTGHPDLGKVVLYQMSYFRMSFARLKNKQLKNLNQHPPFCCGVAKIGHVPFLKKFYSSLFILGSI